MDLMSVKDDGLIVLQFHSFNSFKLIATKKFTQKAFLHYEQKLLSPEEIGS